MITVIKPGLLSTIQDLGRYGYQRFGVISSGAMDPLAHRIANMLVGNDENQPTLEITLLGPTLKFEADALISICGGDLSPEINGKSVHTWRSIFVKKGSELRFGACNAGCRAYLAVAGGFKVPTVMNSKSTYLRAEIGGFHGRALKQGDQLPIQMPEGFAKQMLEYLQRKTKNHPFKQMKWSIGSGLLSIYRKESPIHVMEGREFHLFSKESKESFFSSSFEVTAKSDRMGYRLKGSPLHLEKRAEMVSEAVSFGTIQIPSDGNPIILLADRQTTGGYPKIGQIATVDIPLVAQAKPGDSLSFKKISHVEAQRLYLKREQKLRKLKQGIYLKFK